MYLERKKNGKAAVRKHLEGNQRRRSWGKGRFRSRWATLVLRAHEIPSGDWREDFPPPNLRSCLESGGQ